MLKKLVFSDFVFKLLIHPKYQNPAFVGLWWIIVPAVITRGDPKQSQICSWHINVDEWT